MRWNNSKGSVEFTSGEKSGQDPVAVSEAIRLGLAHHQAGRLEKAKIIYQSILKTQPHQPEALHYLGLIAHQDGTNEVAVELIEKAISAKPNVAFFHNNLGIALSAQGRLEEALACYEQALVINPDYAEALYNLGNALQGLGRAGDAIDYYKNALVIKPGYAEAHHNLGNALQNLGRTEEAIDCYEQALVIKPDSAERHFKLGNALMRTGRYEEAIACYERALEIQPESFMVHNNLGIALKDMDRYQDAITHFERALAIRPDYAQGHNNLGAAFRQMGRNAEAIDCYKKALAIQPDLPGAHYNLGMLYLLTGHFEQGWKHYEWRWEVADFPSPKRPFTQPTWNGLPLAGRTLLLHTEQGLGDAIQFMRYVPLVAAKAGKVIVECDAALIDLFPDYKEIASFVGKDEKLPDFDVHCPLLSLPGIFQTTLESIPGDTGYISTDKTLVQAWQKKLFDVKQFRVGLCWQGRREHKGDRFRSIRLNQFSKLLAMENVDVISLQAGFGQEQIEEHALIHDFPSDIDTFTGTAALMEHLDLVIGVDTSMVHLAGALGRPVWVLLHDAPDWRWMLDREDSPWYPGLRIFRQGNRGEWQPVIDEVVSELGRLLTNA